MKMNNFWKAASRKSKMFFLFSALILAAVIALLSVLFSSLLIRPEKIRLKSDVSAVFADERYEYYGETDGKIERADESGVKTFADLGSKILLLEKLGENLAVATEDRKITLFNENGGIEAQTAINLVDDAVRGKDGQKIAFPIVADRDDGDFEKQRVDALAVDEIALVRALRLVHRVGREIQKIQIFVETVHLVAVDFRTVRSGKRSSDRPFLVRRHQPIRRQGRTARRAGTGL